MDPAAQRREQRYNVKLKAILFKGGTQIQTLTEDISFKGVFLRTDSPPALRQLVKIALILPPEGREIKAHGMVANNSLPGNAEGHVPGAGIQFYGMDGGTKEVWENFVAQIQRHASEPTPPPADAVDPVRRKHERFNAHLELRLQMDELFTLYTRDVSRGGMLVATDLDLELGSNLVIDVLHPETGKSFPVQCVVRRKIDQPDLRGVGVEFINMSELHRNNFFDFVRAGIPDVEEEAITLVDERDPNLM